MKTFWIGAMALLIAVLILRNHARNVHPPGIEIPNDPVQTSLLESTGNFFKAGHAIRPLARYSIEARVLHKKRYYGGPLADIAPVDLAVGWGPMSDQRVLDQLKITQGNRFFFWEYEDQPPLPIPEIISHASNMHLIAANSAISWNLWKVSAGMLVKLTGHLVEVEMDKNSPPWRSSLSRTDTGNGACEIMWVESVEEITNTPLH